MKLKRKSPGVYESADGRVQVLRHSFLDFNGKRHRKEITWSATVDGEDALRYDCPNKREAIEAAHKLLEKKGAK